MLVCGEMLQMGLGPQRTSTRLYGAVRTASLLSADEVVLFAVSNSYLWYMLRWFEAKTEADGI